MTLKKMAIACLTLSMLVVASATSVSAVDVSIEQNKGSGTLTAYSNGANATTYNNIGNYYTYAKATVDYSDGDWDSNWDDGLRSADATVSAKSGATITVWSSTHAVRSAQAYNEGAEYMGYGQISS
ncbi:MAG: hypothetical protein J6I45_00960 [Clostridia bacterium]|nr:hypothetical protein [Clostridia bacterium]